MGKFKFSFGEKVLNKLIWNLFLIVIIVFVLGEIACQFGKSIGEAIR